MADEDFPVLGLHRGQPVPLLREIPQARWRELLAPLTDGARRQAAQSVPYGQHGDVLVLIAELELEDLERSACCTSTAVSTAQAGARARHPTTTPRSENITSR